MLLLSLDVSSVMSAAVAIQDDSSNERARDDRFMEITEICGNCCIVCAEGAFCIGEQ